MGTWATQYLGGGNQKPLVPAQEPPARTCWPPAPAAPARTEASAGSRRTTRASPAAARPAGKVGAAARALPCCGLRRVLGARHPSLGMSSSTSGSGYPTRCVRRSDVRDRHQRVREEPLPQRGHVPEHQRQLPLPLQGGLRRPQLRHRHRRLPAQ